MNTEYQRKLAKVNELNRLLRNQLVLMNRIKSLNETLKFQITFSNDLLGKQYAKLQLTLQLLRSAENALIEKLQIILDMNRYKLTDWDQDHECDLYFDEDEDPIDAIEVDTLDKDNDDMLLLLTDMHKVLLLINKKMDYLPCTITWKNK